jgi:hypothetical protein
MTLSENTKLRRSASVVCREIASETVVVPVRGGVGDLNSIFSFNLVGSDLWNLLEKDISLGEMASWVEEQYEVSRQKALDDIREFIGELVSAGLASISPAAVLEIVPEPIS